jgi:hypothetical protein
MQDSGSITLGAQQVRVLCDGHQADWRTMANPLSFVSRQSTLCIVTALFVFKPAVILACVIAIGKKVQFFVALKPPGSYRLHVLAWNGSHLDQWSSSLVEEDNPVFLTVYQDPGDGVLGTQQLQCCPGC